MIKIANQILDAYDDVSKEGLKKLASIRPGCNMISAEEKSALKDHQFALTVITKSASKLNKYPICDADSTWLSSGFFEMNHHKLPMEAAEIAASHLKVACEKFKITPGVAVSSLAKTASDNVYFEKDGALKRVNACVKCDLTKIAQVEEIGNNYTSAQYAMPAPNHVKIAGDYFEKNASKMPLEVRHKYAAAIQRRGHELGMAPLKGLISKYASDHYSPMVDAHIRSRASLLEGRPDLKSTVEKIGAAKKNYSPSQFAQLLHGFDKQAGLSRYYGSHLQDPYTATFASQPDPNAGFRYKNAGVSDVTADDLHKVVNAKYAQIKDYFGPHLADEMKKDPVTIFESLPRDAKEVIAGIIEGTH